MSERENAVPGIKHPPNAEWENNVLQCHVLFKILSKGLYRHKRLCKVELQSKLSLIKLNFPYWSLTIFPDFTYLQKSPGTVHFFIVLAKWNIYHTHVGPYNKFLFLHKPPSVKFTPHLSLLFHQEVGFEKYKFRDFSGSIYWHMCVPLFDFSALWFSEMQFGVIYLETWGGTHWHWCRWCYTNFTQWTDSTNCQPTIPVVHRFTGGSSGSWEMEPPHINTLTHLAFWPQEKEDKIHPQTKSFRLDTGHNRHWLMQWKWIWCSVCSAPPPPPK
jgi:hypothetical protein